jgi:hypothetical protein
MNKEDLITELVSLVNEKSREILQHAELMEIASLDKIQALVARVAKQLCAGIFEAWKAILMTWGEQIGRVCPCCKNNRKWKWRSKQPMKLQVLGLDIELPNPYLECGHCDAPGLSVIRLLTGLGSGDCSTELELLAARCAAKDSYGNAAKDLQAHHGQKVERTKVRRMALLVEQEAMKFAEAGRQEALEEFSTEGRRPGPDLLVFEGDGGKVRCGRLEDLQPDEKGYGEKTLNRGLPKRKRPPHFRELITMDVRGLGEMEPRGLDVMVPALSGDGERERRMLALAIYAGLGDDTEMYGLGDMGSGLARAFEEAFHAHNPFWEADRKHTWDYVKDASKVLEGVDVTEWRQQMWEAIWERDVARRDELIEQAHAHRTESLPAEYDKCPVKAMETYLRNNWRHMRFKEMEARGLPIVSARAESQVRDRTKKRFSVAGVWREENIEPKAILRAIIRQDTWEEFRTYVIDKRDNTFRRELIERLEEAVLKGRLNPDTVQDVLAPSPAVSAPQANEAPSPKQQDVAV